MTLDGVIGGQKTNDACPSPERPGILEDLEELIQNGAGDRRTVQCILQNLIKAYKENPNILPHFLKLDWRIRDKVFFETFKSLVLGIASSNPTCISLIIDSIISSFTQTTTENDPIKAGVKDSDSDSDSRAIIIISSLVKLAPSSSTLLMPTIEYYFPFHAKSTQENISYVKNLLSLAESMPVWRYKILELIITRALVIDVELQNDLEALKRIDTTTSCKVSQAQAQGQASLERKEYPLEPSKEEPSELKKVKEQRMVEAVLVGIEKLDQMLEMLFYHIDHFIRIGAGGEELDEKRSSEMFSFILGVFERIILPTFKSRYVQFLTFYMSSLRPELADQFLGLLFKPLVQFCQGLDNGQSATPTPNLLLSVTYIGSFVARAKFLSDDLLKLAFEMLIDLSTRLLLRLTITNSPGILPIISLQHIMYIFTWRYKELLLVIGKGELADLFDILLEDSTILHYCNQNVVKNFLTIAGRQLEIVDPEVVRAFGNFQVTTTTRGGCGRSFASKYEDLESYFPFHPITLLSGCKKFIPNHLYSLKEGDHKDEDDHEQGNINIIIINNEKNNNNSIKSLQTSDDDNNNNFNEAYSIIPLESSSAFMKGDDDKEEIKSGRPSL